MDNYGITIGPSAGEGGAHWSIFGHEMRIKIDEDVYVWCRSASD